jgi:hypothetical protein
MEKRKKIKNRLFTMKIADMLRIKKCRFVTINIAVTILDNIHRPVFYLKLNSTL